MVATLRIVNVQINSSSSISVTFNYTLTSNLVPANVSILSQTPNVFDSQVLSVSVAGAVLTIDCQPLIQFSAYILQFQNTTLNPFVSTNGQAQVSQDGVSNRYLLTAPIDPDNPIKNYLDSFYNGNIYEIEDNTLVGQYVNAISVNLARALYDIRQAKNENYLSVTIIDEQQVRGNGPTDRLNEESAYEILRVGGGPTGATATTTFIFPDFPDYPVTLQRQLNTETLLPNSVDQSGTFNINTLTMNLNHLPVTRINSIVFTLITANPVYTYNISELGYQIQNSEYDQDNASSYAQLTTSQIRLNAALLSDPLFSLDNIFNISVQYESKNLGIVVDPTTVDVYTTSKSVREVVPPIINIFSLQHAPITDSTNNTPTSGGVIFTDPNNNVPGALHPAFLYEIPYSLSSLPSIPGQYSINYPTGTVYVYGQSITNDGTGPYPPLATYYYRLTYVSEIDYVYDADASNLVALPIGSLINSTGTIAFGFELVFIPGVDYIANIHIESINENVGNNLVALNAIVAQNSPITNVFQIYNQTSGEIYTLNRWYNNTIYFNYNNPPAVETENGERVTFENVTNELLFVNTTYTNSSDIIIFKSDLNNNTIIDGTEDGTATSFNSSMSFSDGNVFVSEKWFDLEQNEANNTNRLSNIGEYMVDYIHGIVYCAVSNTQMSDIGTVSYKLNSIVPEFPSIISVNDLYYRISILNPKNKQFVYTSFGEGFVVPDGLDPADELYLNGVATAPYQLLNGTIGAFVGSSFVPGVTNQVKFVRSVFEHQDLLNSTAPLNFAIASTSSNFNINVGSITGQTFEGVQFDVDGYYVLVNVNVPYLSPNIAYNFTVVRTSDSQNLWNTPGTIIPGNPLKLILSPSVSVNVGDLVNVTYNFTITPVSRVIIDYNKGDFFVDYTYVADELLISYEWGDNSLDFSQSNSIDPSTQYYVSYRVGALRDALLKNFGTLINVPELSSFDITLDRERYREAMEAALSSFIQGPTVPAIKNIGQIISHIEPQINESFLEGWVLGSSLLNPQSIISTGAFQSLPAKFGNGILINQPDQSVKFPANDNIRLEEGTFETWVLPQWNGLDNDAELTFNITRNGVPIEDGYVLIGPGEYNPIINNGTFSVSKLNNVMGVPNTNKDGVYIYYQLDPTKSFYRWNLEIIDGYNFGLAKPAASYQIKIGSNGKFYNVKSFTPTQPSNMSIFTGLRSVSLSIAGGGQIDEGITFISDLDHYLLDFGESPDKNRLSIYKDSSGYMNFRVFDNKGTSYNVSSNISDWKVNEVHQVAASWKLNTRNNRDELHLFIDGLEVPNLSPFAGPALRTVDPEEIISPYTIVGSDDLVTTVGSDVVTSSINFSAFGIEPGSMLTIREVGFAASPGYHITGVNGQTLTLLENMPLSITNGSYSVNQTSFVVTSQINVVPNITVSTSATQDGVEVELPGVRALQPDYAISQDSNFNNVLTVYNGVAADGYIFIRTLGVNYKTAKHRYYLWSNNQENVLMTQLPPPISLDAVNITKVILPAVAFKFSYSADSGDFSQPSNSQIGRTLVVTLSGTNVDFSSLNTVTIDGYNSMGYLSETLSFTDYGSLDTVNQFTSIISIDSDLIPVNSNKNAGAISISEKYPITFSEDGGQVPIIRYSYPITAGYTLVSGSYMDGYQVVTDLNNLFSFSDIGNYLYINTPASVAGFYNIVGVSTDRNSLFIQQKASAFPVPTANFSGAAYQVYNVSNYRSGFQNGFFTFENPNPYFAYAVPVVNQFNPPVLPIPVINVNSTVGFPVFGNILITTDLGTQVVSYTGTTPTSFTGCAGGSGTVLYPIVNGTPYYYVTTSNDYYLGQGFYDIEYYTYISAKFDSVNSYAYVGSDLKGNNQADCIVNEMKIYSIMLTDTRVGETALATQRTITKDFNSLKALLPDINTLMLVTFNNLPLTNTARFYVNSNADGQLFSSAFTVNDNFGQSIVVQNKPIVVSNAGILDTRKQGTVEFWVSPIYDTGNDPAIRYYFDAFGAVVEEVVSTSNTIVSISAPASQILSVTLKAGNPNQDYFAGGKLEINTQRAIQEEGISIGTGSVVVSQPILQVISVKIIGDLTGKDYFNDGSVSTDLQTIYLGKPLPVPNIPLIITYQTTNNGNKTINTQIISLNRKLPYQNTMVVVKYIPSGLQGDRLAVYKDQSGFVNFGITASGTDYVLRAPTTWAAGTWHRVKASYQINGGMGTDNMHLFIDGYQYSDFTFGQNIIFGTSPIVFGAVTIGAAPMSFGNIIFEDPINQLIIGNSYDNTGPIFSLLDNFRISNISRPIYAPYGEPIDVNYSSNQSIVFPVTQDLYTTYLMDYNSLTTLNTSFSTIVNRNTGGFDFSVNIIDSFGIVSGSAQVQQILEELINVLKPANSLAVIQYTE